MRNKLHVLLLGVFAASSLAQGKETERLIHVIHVQSAFPPLQFADAPMGGAHPVGGPAMRFVQLANRVLASRSVRFEFHVTGDVHPADKGNTSPQLVSLDKKFKNIYEATAAGAEQGGLNVGIGIPIQNGLAFGELFVASPPFGMEPDEYIGYLYSGGGLDLQQQLYDEHFNENLLVLPIAITASQGAGWFPEPLPDPDSDDNLSNAKAMAALCERPWLVRWPKPAAEVWKAACANAGVQTASVGESTRCKYPTRQCPSTSNPIVTEVQSLTFGGFVPGGLPHAMVRTNNIDAYELNLPLADVHLSKLVLDEWNTANGNVSLQPIISSAPFLYAGSWHQPVSYIEVVFNRKYWQSLDDAERALIESAAQSATLLNFAASIDNQGEAIDLLKKNGAVVLRWPEGLLQQLRKASDEALNKRADEFGSAGDSSYRRVLNHMRDYIQASAEFNDFGDVNQGRGQLKTSPLPVPFRQP